MLIFFSILVVLTRIFMSLCVESGNGVGNIEIYTIVTVAKEIIEGLSLPIWDYQFSSYDGGVLVLCILIVPLCMLFGYTTLPMLIIAISFTLGIYVVWYLFLKRHFNQRVANIFSCLYIICPYLYLRWGIVIGGNHKEIMVFMVLFLFLVYELFFNEKLRLNRFKYHLSIFFLGVLGGFSTWFCFTFLVILIPSTLMWYFYNRRFVPKLFFLLFGGYVLGYFPGYFRISAFSKPIVNEIFSQIVRNGPGEFIDKFKGLLAINTSGSPSLSLNLYWLIFVLLLFLLVWKNRGHIGDIGKGLWRFQPDTLPAPNKEMAIILYPLIHLFLYAISDFNIVYGDTDPYHYRYIIPIFPFIFTIIALAADFIMKRKAMIHKGFGIVLTIFCLFLGIKDCILNINIKKFPNSEYIFAESISYEMLGAIISWRAEDDPAKAIEALNLIREDYRAEAYRGYGFEMGVMGSGHNFYKIFEDNAYVRHFWNGYIIGIGAHNFEGTEIFEAYPIVIKELARKEYIEYFIETAQSIHAQEDIFKSNCFTGLGMQFNIVSEQIEDVPEELKSIIGRKYWIDFTEGHKLIRPFEQNFPGS